MSGGAELLQAERDRLQNAVAHLEESNVQLRAAVAQEADSELREAVGVRDLLEENYVCFAENFVASLYRKRAPVARVCAHTGVSCAVVLSRTC